MQTLHVMGLTVIDEQHLQVPLTMVKLALSFCITVGTPDVILKPPDPPTTILTDPILSTTMVGQAVETDRFPGWI